MRGRLSASASAASSASQTFTNRMNAAKRRQMQAAAEVEEEGGEDELQRRVKKFGAVLGAAAGRGEVSRYDLLRPGSGTDALLAEQPVVVMDPFEAAGAASGGDADDDAFIASSGERADDAGDAAARHAGDVARQQLKLEFAFTQFDLERLSMRYCVCGMCGRASVLCWAGS